MTSGATERRRRGLPRARAAVRVPARGRRPRSLLRALRAPVIEARFPGPAVHAKTARGEMARFCATERVDHPEQLRGFHGSGGWAYVERESTPTTYVFHRGAAPAASKAKAAPAKAQAASSGGSAAKRRKRAS